MGLKDKPTASTNLFYYKGLNVNIDSGDRFLPTSKLNNDSKGRGKNLTKIKQFFTGGAQNYQIQFPI